MTRKKMDSKLISVLVVVLVCAGLVSAQEEGAAPVRRLTNIINSYPVEYLYGCLAADFFIGKRRRRKKRNRSNVAQHQLIPRSVNRRSLG